MEEKEMIIKVHMLAFMERGNVRKVEVADTEIEGLCQDDILEKIFYYGQNDFAISENVEDQRRTHPSVSVGDVVEYNDTYFKVDICGFKEITKDEFNSLTGKRAHEAYGFKEKVV